MLIDFFFKLKAVEVPVWVGRARSGSPAIPSHTWA